MPDLMQMYVSIRYPVIAAHGNAVGTVAEAHPGAVAHCFQGGLPKLLRQVAP